MLEKAILLVLLSLPPFYSDKNEPAKGRTARLEKAARAIAQAAENSELPTIPLAAALIQQGYSETKFARYVGEGRCKDGPKGSQCDLDQNGQPRARTYWQTWKVFCPKAWKLSPGSQDELNAAAECVARTMERGFRICSSKGLDGWTGAFARQRGPAFCTTKKAPARARARIEIERKLTEFASSFFNSHPQRNDCK